MLITSAIHIIPHWSFNASTIHVVRHACVFSKNSNSPTTSFCSTRSDKSGPQIKTVWLRIISSCAFSVDDLQAAQIACTCRRILRYGTVSTLTSGRSTKQRTYIFRGQV